MDADHAAAWSKGGGKKNSELSAVCKTIIEPKETGKAGQHSAD